MQFFECLMKRSVSPVCIELEVVNLFCRYGFVFLFARCPYFMVFCFWMMLSVQLLSKSELSASWSHTKKENSYKPIRWFRKASKRQPRCHRILNVDLDSVHSFCSPCFCLEKVRGIWKASFVVFLVVCIKHAATCDWTDLFSMLANDGAS